MTITKIALCTLSVFIPGLLRCQTVFPTGFYSPEGYSLSDGDHHYIILKDYALPSAERIKAIHEEGQFTYLDLPLSVREASFGGSSFTTRLFCLNNSGSLLWQKVVGSSAISNKPALAIDLDGMIYTGGLNTALDAGVSISKFDPDGNELWTTDTDSLEEIQSIYVDTAAQITVLAYYKRSYLKPVNGDDGLMALEEVRNYHTLRIDKQTGEILEDQYGDQLTNMLAEVQATIPTIQDHYVQYFFGQKAIYVYLNWKDQLMGIPPIDTTYSFTDMIYGRDSYSILGKKNENDWQLSTWYSAEKEQYNRSVEVEASSKRDGFVLPNDLRGTTVLFCGKTSIEMYKYDKNLNLKLKKDIRLDKKISLDMVVSVNIDDGGDYRLYHMFVEGTGEKQRRHIRQLVLTKDGSIASE
ncbi:MAG: hypothetical protein AB7H80_07210 [Candidatus Kapaibacterium sp.]